MSPRKPKAIRSRNSNWISRLLVDFVPVEIPRPEALSIQSPVKQHGRRNKDIKHRVNKRGAGVSRLVAKSPRALESSLHSSTAPASIGSASGQVEDDSAPDNAAGAVGLQPEPQPVNIATYADTSIANPYAGHIDPGAVIRVGNHQHDRISPRSITFSPHRGSIDNSIPSMRPTHPPPVSPNKSPDLQQRRTASHSLATSVPRSMTRNFTLLHLVGPDNVVHLMPAAHEPHCQNSYFPMHFTMMLGWRFNAKGTTREIYHVNLPPSDDCSLGKIVPHFFVSNMGILPGVGSSREPLIVNAYIIPGPELLEGSWSVDIDILRSRWNHSHIILGSNLHSNLEGFGHVTVPHLQTDQGWMIQV